MPTIAYISAQFPLRSETFVYREVRELRRRGWGVVCVTLNPPVDIPEGAEDLIDKRITVYRDKWFLDNDANIEYAGRFKHSLVTQCRAFKDMILPGECTGLSTRAKFGAQWRGGLLLAAELRRRNVSHIHCHFAHAPASVGMYAAMQLNIPFSFTGHANDLFQRRALLKRKLQRAQFVSCISLEHRALYNTIYPRPDNEYPVIRCGVDIKQFTTANRVKSHAPQVLTVCRLVEKKGVDTLVHAFNQFNHPTAELLIAGDGPQRNALEAMVDSGLRGRVRFLGAISNDRVRELIQSCDVFALPCRVDRNGDKDGIPVVLIEAMACGVPVIAGDLPAIRELVINHHTGLLVNATHAEPTRDALHELFNNTETARALGAAGQTHVADEFSLQNNVDRLEAALRQT
jgi:colanic acid/amylovoran biosynthesis glycosyltransferase